MIKIILSLAMALLLVACGSSVKLDSVPVEDRTGAAVTPDAVGVPAVDAGTVGKSAVTSIDLDKSAQGVNGPLAERTVYFEYDSFAIKPEFQSVIEKQANLLKANKARKVAIEGHTDERGGREYNLALGQKRSEAVRRALSLLGVSDSQMEAVSFGEEKPAQPGSDEASMAKNRRAEISSR
ncbi:MAG: peptidoglycan-associated lipoprotein Pal [Burkholderiaceae bacterium]